MLMVQQCAGQRGQRPAQAEIALGNKGLTVSLLYSTHASKWTEERRATHWARSHYLHC